MNDLNNTALLLIADTVTLGKVSFERTRQQIKNIIKKYLVVVLTESNYKDRLVLLNQLSQIFRNPNNFQGTQLTLFTPVHAPLLTSIDKLLGRLHEMSVHTLLVMNRKLKGAKYIPQFPPVISISCKKEVFKERVGKKCHQMVSKLKEGMDLPKPLAKALSVMLLFLKQETGRMDITISEFFPFSSKTMDLQDDILRALWSLRKVKYAELKAIQSLIDPAAKIPWKTFRTTLSKYLMECLFECDEIGVSEEALRILTAINRRSRRQVCLISKEAKEEEIESVLNVSSQLKQFFSGILPESAVNEEGSQELESDGVIENNDFVLFEIGCHSYMDVLQHQPTSNNELKTTEDSLPSHSSFMDQEAVTDKNPKQTSLAQDTDTNVLHAASKPVELRPNTSQVIQDICDETSLLSHKIIGHWLDKVMKLEGIQTYAVTRSYLRGESSQPVDLRGSDTEECLGSPEGDEGPLILLQVVEELLPNFPMSSLERMKKTLAQS
ncbi:hypothetical protein J5N97_012614 [Dioscorea zingiberensis]|uniref:Uncharacterized protein n=1 Tax=Dioscorea zingiberensis TaxID=325984 RepID=A0A9D5CRU3_9LILI|nr:hypothetical protein J5N97_012614 [Dioscorea zingiberensis]